MNLIRTLDQPNAIASIMNRAAAARINLAGGWGDYPPPPGLLGAAQEVVCSATRFHAASRYSETAGRADLRNLLVEKVERELFGRGPISPNDLVVTDGATQAGLQLLWILGSPVVLTDPAYANYADQAALLDLSVIRLPVLGPDGEFLPDLSPSAVTAGFEQICRRQAPTCIVIVSPDNPTGCVWPDGTLDDMLGIASRFGVRVLLDRAYAFAWFGERPEHLGWTHRSHSALVALESLSKSFSLLGLRLGYAAGPQKVAGLIQAITQRTTLTPSTLSQQILATFLAQTSGDTLREYLQEARLAYASAYRTARLAVERVAPVRFTDARGGFYLTFKTPDGNADDVAFCEELSQEAGILTVPGSAFGSCTRGWIRTSFAPLVRNVATLTSAYNELASFIGGRGDA